MTVRSSPPNASNGSSSILKIPTAKVFEPLLQPARYRGAFGGRGSGKSHFFGELLVETCQAERGTLAVCIRESQRTLAQSSKRLIESKITALGVGSGFRLYSDKIETPGDGVIIFRGMQAEAVNWIKEKSRGLRERLKGWKTIILGATAAAPLALLELVEQLKLADPSSFLPEPWGQRIALGLAIAMILLRLITTGPVGSKGEEEPDQDLKAGE